MTPSSASIAADTQKSGPTGPRTAEGKARCRLNAFRHGLTGQTFVFAADEAAAFAKHATAITGFYKPVGPVETVLTAQIASAMWRLLRVHAIEEGIFAMDAAVAPGPGADRVVTSASIIGPAHAWVEQARSFDLLGKYERRIRRALDRDKSELAALQSARKQQPAEGPHHAAEPEGKPNDPSVVQSSPLAPESVFSPEIAVPEAARPDALFRVQQRPKAA